MDDRQGAEQRARMVSEQLAARGIRDPRVLDAMGRVPRERFLPRWLRDAAYADGPIEIGSGQTISQPYVVAATLEAAEIQPTDKILDVGTGSGYAAAVAALLAAEVCSIERIADLGRRAEKRLQRLGYGNVRVRVGDGSLGWPEEAPFDAIVCAAAGPRVPEAWTQQLAPGGRVVAPIGSRFSQDLIVVRRTATGFERRTLMSVRYVPLLGAQGFDEHPEPDEFDL